MKKLKLFGVLLSLLAGGLAVFAQSQPSQKPTERSAPPMMMCPMMNKNEGPPTKGNMQERMQGMAQRMASMFSLSAEEISARLKEKKTELSLSDTQVKHVAELIASSEQQKIKDKVQGMTSQTQAGQMKCPCMQSSNN